MERERGERGSSPILTLKCVEREKKKGRLVVLWLTKKKGRAGVG